MKLHYMCFALVCDFCFFRACLCAAASDRTLSKQFDLSAMAAAFLELNKIQHQRICRKGLQTALVHHRQTTVQLQAIEIVGLKRKLAQMQEERDHFRQHCSDLYQRCDEQQEALSSTKSKMFDAIESIVQLEDMIARKHKDCPILKTAVAKVIAELDILEADLTDIVYSDGESDESGSESEEEAPLDEADIPVNDVVVPPAN